MVHGAWCMGMGKKRADLYLASAFLTHFLVWVCTLVDWTGLGWGGKKGCRAAHW